MLGLKNMVWMCRLYHRYSVSPGYKRGDFRGTPPYPRQEAAPPATPYEWSVQVNLRGEEKWGIFERHTKPFSRRNPYKEVYRKITRGKASRIAATDCQGSSIGPKTDACADLAQRWDASMNPSCQATN